MADAKVRVTVDRIEEKRLAVLTVHGGGQWVLPLKGLPRGLKEGQTFDVSWTRNRSAEKRLRAEVTGLQELLQARTRQRKG